MAAATCMSSTVVPLNSFFSFLLFSTTNPTASCSRARWWSRLDSLSTELRSFHAWRCSLSTRSWLVRSSVEKTQGARVKWYLNPKCWLWLRLFAFCSKHSTVSMDTVNALRLNFAVFMIFFRAHLYVFSDTWRKIDPPWLCSRLWCRHTTLGGKGTLRDNTVTYLL